MAGRSRLPRRQPLAVGIVVTTLIATSCFGRSSPTSGTGAAGSPSSSASPSASPSRPPTNPDIYYLVLDDYGGRRAMQDQLGFDNGPFVQALARRGFVVPEHPTTNYPRTSLSLATSFNLDYLQALLKPVPPIQSTAAPLYSLIRHAEAPRFLKARGYRFVHLGSWWPGTRTSPQADVEIAMHGSVPDVAAQVGVHVPEPPPGAPLGTFLFDRREYVRVAFEFHELAMIRHLKQPTFVFGHILLPHRPFVFDAAGRFIPPGRKDPRPMPERYADQVRAVNRKVLKLVDHLLARPAGRRPVIVVQSDEGFYDALANNGVPGDRTLQQHFGILAAYYFPGVTLRPAPTVTPVNTFRMVFDAYFDAGMPLLPDRNYVYPNVHHLYTFIDVTDRVRALS
jgi:hypothetical protein